MVLIRQINNEIVVASADNIIHSNLHTHSDEIIKIPDPVLPENLTKGQIDVLKKEDRTIISLEYSKDMNYLVVSTENKQVIVYNRNFDVVKNFIVGRTASKVCFTKSNDILVADRTGDVYLYKLDNIKDPPVLLLGHLSVILDVLFSECGNFIITCDRDEKIRVSRFPNSYNIVSYCLGHREFVICIKLVENILVSASGDGTVRFWNYEKGEQLGIIHTNDHVKDINLFKTFSKEMDVEKVDVTALPITDMQIFNSHNLFIAVSIHNYNFIQLYASDLKTCKSTFISKIELPSPIFSYSLDLNFYILSENFRHLQLINENYVLCDSKYLNELFLKYQHVIKFTDVGITGLYKRKFDNVQEYLERKRQRLEAK